MDHHQEDLLRPEVLAAFRRDTFEQEGYWVWEGILTDAGRRQFVHSLTSMQELNDRIVMDTDWSVIDYSAHGLSSPDPEQISDSFRAGCCGGSEQAGWMPEDWRATMHERGLVGAGPGLATQGFESEGFMPEYFPAAYDDFLLDIISGHPQMLALFGKLLGRDFRMDHAIMLNRTAGSRGRNWHAHAYRDGANEVEDRWGTGHFKTREFLHLQCVRTLCYPEGANLETGGELAIIPGSHLYRIPYKEDGGREESDDAAMQPWLRGKTHAFTGRPLEIVHLDLPPGSMVSFVHHMPHFVSNRKPEAGTRWGMLMAYRTPDPNAEPRKWSAGVPAHWADRQEAAGGLSAMAKQIFRGDVAIE